MPERLRVGIIGATGMVGQRFISLLARHPWFDVVTLAASERSAGKCYREAVGDRWRMTTPMPEQAAGLVVKNAALVDEVSKGLDLVFCAVDMPKEETRTLEESYARAEVPVVSNNSANRLAPDVPMVIPELNPEHFAAIEKQKKRLGTKHGFHRRQAELLHPELRPRSPSFARVRHRKSVRLHVPGHIRRGQDVQGLA